MSIVGYGSNSFNYPVPLYWATVSSTPTLLKLLDRGEVGSAYGINNLGQIVGISNNNTSGLPVIWTNANVSPVPLKLVDGTRDGTALDINNLGQIVGFCDNTNNIPVIWSTSNANPMILQLLDGTTGGKASSINNLGQIVGFCDNNTFDIPVIWSTINSKPTTLKLPIGWKNIVNTIGINDLGQIVSYSTSGDSSKPIIWDDLNATPTSLKLLNGTSNGIACGINNLGQIVGNNGNNDTSSIPVIWYNYTLQPTALKILEGYNSILATGISDSLTPISNICFPAGTPVKTDQGIINIDKLNPQKHTLDSQPILRITRTTTLDNYLISFDINSLEKNIPSQKTLMTKDHKIMFGGRLVPAYRFLDFSDKVKKVKYTGETLYNVLLSDHRTINVNNIMCETLHPENIIAKLYMRKDDISLLVYKLNYSLENNDIISYKDVVNQLTNNL